MVVQVCVDELKSAEFDHHGHIFRKYAPQPKAETTNDERSSAGVEAYNEWLDRELSKRETNQKY
jgi:hypothetical protein